MSVEREMKLETPPGFRLPNLDGSTDGLVAVVEDPRKIQTWYHDTRDLRIARWGSSLRYRSEQGWTVKLPPAENGELLVRGEHLFPGGRGRPPEEAVDLLRAYVRTADVEPVVHLRTVRSRVELLTSDGEVVGEVVDDDVRVVEGRRVASRFREVEVEVTESSPSEVLEGVLARLREAGAGNVTTASKYLLALGPRARQPSDVVVVDIDARTASVGDVVRNALAESTIRLLRHDAGVRLGEEPEDVHRARVATRRLRSDLRTFGPFLDSDWTSALRDELKWLGGELGRVRDIEVMLDRLRRGARELPEQDGPATTRLLGRLESAREEARDRLLAAMREPRYTQLLERVVGAAGNPVLNDAASRRADRVLGPTMEEPWQQLRDATEQLNRGSSDDDLHAARIRAKRARYAAEALAPVFGKRARAFSKAAADLQEVLGEHQDAAVAEEWLREASVAGPRQAYVAGELAALERAAAMGARRGWPAAWKSVSRKRLRFWT